MLWQCRGQRELPYMHPCASRGAANKGSRRVGIAWLSLSGMSRRCPVARPSIARRDPIVSPSGRCDPVVPPSAWRGRGVPDVGIRSPVLDPRDFLGGTQEQRLDDTPRDTADDGLGVGRRLPQRVRIAARPGRDGQPRCERSRRPCHCLAACRSDLGLPKCIQAAMSRHFRELA
jgi:hypothetical protein